MLGACRSSLLVRVLFFLVPSCVYWILSVVPDVLYLTFIYNENGSGRRKPGVAPPNKSPPPHLLFLLCKNKIFHFLFASGQILVTILNSHHCINVISQNVIILHNVIQMRFVFPVQCLLSLIYRSGLYKNSMHRKTDSVK